MHKGFWLMAAIAAAPVAVCAAEPASVPAPAFRPGDTWVFDRTFERGTSGFVQRRVSLKLERTAADTMVVGIKVEGSPTNYEDHITGLDWSLKRLIDGKEVATARPFAFPLTVGSTWTSEFTDKSHRGRELSSHFRTTYRVLGWEDVTVPAGVFHTLKIQAEGAGDAELSAAASVANGATITGSGAAAVSQTQVSPAGDVHVLTYEEIYYAPEIKYFVKKISEQYNSDNVRTNRVTDALVSFTPAP